MFEVRKLSSLITIYKDPRNQKVTAMRKKLITLLFIIACYCGWGQVTINNSSFTYTENFNSLPSTTGTSSWTNNTSISGWYLYNKNMTDITTINASGGGTTTGSFFSFGGNSNIERAIGGQGSGGAYFGSPSSGSIAGWIAIALLNSTGQTISSISFNYTGEQWRNGGNTSAQTMVVEYGVGATFSAVTSWTTAGTGFNFTSPITGASDAPLDGNAAANRVTGLGGTISSLNLASNSTLWIRFAEVNDSGNDHGLAIDDFSISTVTLPVSFISFHSFKIGKTNNLEWSTGSETNNSGFEIQRSTDAVNFEKIGFVKSLSATGNSSSRLDYTFTDYNPVGLRQYYRLKQTDFDGTSKYSAVVLVTREAPTALQLTHVYPNPSRESLYINTASPTKMELQLLVIDLGGRVVGKKQVSAEIGNNGFDIPVAHLASGTYILKVLNSSQQVVATEKFIKQ